MHFNLSYCYENGTGIDKDQKKSFKWYFISENGNPKVPNDLADYYHYGIGCLNDI